MSKWQLITLWIGIITSITLSIVAIVKASSSKRCLLNNVIDDMDEGHNRTIEVAEDCINVTTSHHVGVNVRKGTEKLKSKSLG